MLRSYIKTAWRSLLRGRSFSIINIAGLAIGMTSAILILLWVQNEISYDKFHADVNRLYQVWGNDYYDGSIQSGVNTPEIMAPVLKAEVPEIDKVSRITWGEDFLFTVGDKNLKPHGNVVDPDFLSLFSFPVIKGNPNALTNPYSVVITEKLAKKLFGNDDPIGKSITIQRSKNYIVTAVLKDLPANTQFNFEYLRSYASMNGLIDSDWTDVSVRTFVKLKPNTSPDAANAKIKNVIIEHSNHRAKTTEFLYPVSKLRLHSDFKNGKPVGGLIERVRIFLAIAAFILLIACINFMNLSTARSEKRAREVGIRKVAGAEKRSLVLQFLIESVLIAGIAGMLALLLVELFLPAFNQLVQKRLFIPYKNIYFWATGLGFIVFTGVLAGSYPAFFLSAFKPVSVLKGTFKKVNTLVTPRKVLVVLQFTFAIGLIISTIVVEQQVRHAQNRETGYNRKNLVDVFIQGDIDKNYALIKNDLLNSGAANSVTKAQAPLTQNWSAGMSMNWQGKDPNAQIQINRYTEDGDLVKTAGMHLTDGRDIDIAKYGSDSTACLLSESAVKAMGFKNPIGQLIYDDPIDWHVVGVIKDFILESPYEAVKPFMVKGPKYGGSVLLIKLNNDNNIAQSLAKAESIFKTYNPSYPFEYSFVDREYAQKFSDEELIGTLASLFAILTIFISCLGLFGLAAYMAMSRLKEIGVRKVLGASVQHLWLMLSKDFIVLVLISCAVASPIAYYFLHSWLNSYPYHITIGAGIFITGASLALIITIVTISLQSLRAATANPAKSLRTE